jgi:membrane protein
MSILDTLKTYIKEFKDSDLLHYASSLSFHTVLALIPILLISLSVFTQMPIFKEYHKAISDFIFSSLLPSHQDIISKYIDQFLQNTMEMGIFGFIFVLYVSIMFFVDYEYIVSKIFKTKPRGFWHSISTYWTLVTLTPIALGISFYVSHLIQTFFELSGYTNWINLLAILPYLIIWALFFITYMISANIKIETKSAAIASFVASVIWYLSKSLFVYYVLYNKTYLSIYGSFSVVMFFFIWIYFSWIIFIYGLKLCFILNNDRYKDV